MELNLNLISLLNIKQKKKQIYSYKYLGDKNKPSLQNQIRFKAIEEGTFMQGTWCQNQVMY